MIINYITKDPITLVYCLVHAVHSLEEVVNQLNPKKIHRWLNKVLVQVVSDSHHVQYSILERGNMAFFID